MSYNSWTAFQHFVFVCVSVCACVCMSVCVCFWVCAPVCACVCVVRDISYVKQCKCYVTWHVTHVTFCMPHYTHTLLHFYNIRIHSLLHWVMQLQFEKYCSFCIFSAKKTKYIQFCLETKAFFSEGRLFSIRWQVYWEEQNLENQ